jgi:hypothetical protein
MVWRFGMKRLVYMMFIYLGTVSCSSSTSSLEAAPILYANPGQVIRFKIDNANPKNIDIHAQNKWRYVSSFSCKNDKEACICSLKINPDSLPTIFSIFEKQKDSDPQIKVYITIV